MCYRFGISKKILTSYDLYSTISTVLSTSYIYFITIIIIIQRMSRKKMIGFLSYICLYVIFFLQYCKDIKISKGNTQKVLNLFKLVLKRLTMTYVCVYVGEVRASCTKIFYTKCLFSKEFRTYNNNKTSTCKR